LLFDVAQSQCERRCGKEQGNGGKGRGAAAAVHKTSVAA
jgi:hypothetical protein